MLYFFFPDPIAHFSLLLRRTISACRPVYAISSVLSLPLPPSPESFPVEIQRAFSFVQGLTIPFWHGIIIKPFQAGDTGATHAGVAELADARDLKSRGSDPVPVRPRSPAPYRGVEQLVARRAHNPEVAGSSPASATIRKASLSQGSEAFFALNHCSSFVVNRPVLSVFVRSFWAARWAARGNLASNPPSTRRRHGDETVIAESKIPGNS